MKLSLSSCKWAVKHLQKESDTDLFPRPFEIDAIGAFPDEIEKLLQSKDIGSYSWSGGRSTIVPKDILSFRPSTQLEIMDSLLLSAIIREYGNKIERKRIPVNENTVFSYRFEPSSSGRLYSPKTDWIEFWERSIEIAQSVGGWIAIADVNSFYNQIYHHALENQLSSVGIPNEVVTSIKNLLMTLTQGVSRGVPVGPHAAHLLAECVFDPIDRSLRSQGHTFCRFVDDIHIFCKSYEDAKIALIDLANTLDKQQKLTLQRHKLQIFSADVFIEFAKKMLAEAPHENLEKDIIEAIDRYSDGNRYRHIPSSKLSSDDLQIFSQENLERLLQSYIAQDEPNYTHIRWFFRRLAQVGVPGAVPISIIKLEQFSPALADLAAYLLSAKHNFPGNWKDMGIYILQALNLPVIQRLEYLTIILLDLCARLPALDHVENILRMYPKSSPMVRRKIVRVATVHRADYWLHEQKEDFPNADPWLKRALIAGASTFGKDERDYWLRRTQKEGTDIEKIVAKWARTN